MAKFEDTLNDGVVECPYCGYIYQPELEDYDEEESEVECDECGNKFYTNKIFSVSHQAKPDCDLNGIKHNYELVNLNNGKHHPFCTVCGKCQPHKELR